MKKIMNYLLICFLSIATLSIRVNAKSIFEGQTLTIFNVEDYISTGEDDYADTIGDFEEKYGVHMEDRLNLAESLTISQLADKVLVAVEEL
ncbi:MAG: hypothetical protein BHW12_06895 [Coprobacillus sp. 28_7]|nr:MAG: hypothetical protein BHW12_06895 [Coprobacillus sp. 28_7]